MAAANRLACSSSLQGVHAARCGAVLPPAMELTKAVTISSWAASANFQKLSPERERERERERCSLSLSLSLSSLSLMGLVMSLGGALGAGGGGALEQPPYEVLETREGYTVRRYAPMVLAVASAEVDPGAPDSKDSELFTVLAGYIGVRGAPRNAQGRGIAMTAPVITHVEGAGPAAGLGRRKTMAFVLPRRFSRPEQAPTPTSPSVSIVAIPARLCAVKRFSGMCVASVC